MILIEVEVFFEILPGEGDIVSGQVDFQIACVGDDDVGTGQPPRQKDIVEKAVPVIRVINADVFDFLPIN